MKLDFFTCGNITIDYIITPERKVKNAICGGNALYAAIGGAIWGRKIGVVSKIGCDFPQEFFEPFISKGIDIRGVERVEQPHVSISGIEYHTDGSRRYFEVDRNVLKDKELITADNIEDHSYQQENVIPGFFDPTPEYVPADYWQAEGICVCSLCGYSQRGFSKTAILHQEQKHLLFDGSDEEPNPPKLKELLEGVEFFMPSEVELGTWFSSSDKPEEIFRVLASSSKSLKGIILKMGEKGAICYDIKAGKRFQLPVYPWTNVLDTTGAGDSFCGGFLSGYLETENFFKAAQFAAVSSSFIIEAFDSRSALLVTKEDAHERLNKYSKYLNNY